MGYAGREIWTSVMLQQAGVERKRMENRRCREREKTKPFPPSCQGVEFFALLRRRLADQHLVRDAVNPLRTPGDEDPCVDERGELRDDLMVLDVHGADLDHPVATGGGKPRRFDVDYHVAVKQVHDLRFIRFLRTFWFEKGLY